MNEFWFYDIKVLLNKNYIMEIWPNSSWGLNRKLNAITRLILLVGIVGYFMTKSIKIVISLLFTLISIIIIYKVKSEHNIKNTDTIKENFENFNVLEKNNIIQDNFTTPTEKNPFMNVLIPEIKYNTNRKKAAPSYNAQISEEINNKSKNKNKKLFRDLGDNINFDVSLRNFHTMPNTSIPNNQIEFAKFCYGNMPSHKDGTFEHRI